MRTVRRISIILIAVFLLAMLPGCSTNVVAKVNGEDITKPQLDSLFQQVAASMGGSVDDTATVRQQALEYLVDSTLIVQDATRLGADLSDEAVETSLTALRGDVSADAYEQQVITAGYTMDQLKTNIREEIARNFLSEKVNEESATATLPDGMCCSMTSF